MNIEHERLKEILAEAAAKDTADDRAGYLDAACQGDPDLRRHVEALLAAHDRAGDFLVQSVVPPEAHPLGEGAGSVIGRYRLLEEIGEGGFGRVFMAEQTEPVHRKVALKIIKAGMDTREVIARFEAERQALAMMDHPNIARVLDAGATDTGRPYFVMEIVRGIPITDYCDQQQLPTAERLELFINVCAAVQHAHQKGIIHRDLKPTNILVTLIDGAAVPKVIDFGVAKALGQQLTEKTLFTSLQQMIGTPAYMSPEQAELSGVDVDTRSDIYSLGVLLYELLTGMTPFDPQTLHQAALDEIRRMILETEPPKPSTRLMEMARGRKSEVGSQKWKEVHGDLDWIAMKCLEKDRARRYPTASDLAQDIGRYLHHEPVTAGAPGAFYRIGKFIRRHRFGIITAAALVALLVAGVVVSTWQAVRAIRAEKEAQTVATFLEDMLNSVKPEETKGRDTTLLRQMLDRAAARVDTELKSEPLIEAGLRHTLGEVYSALGEYPKAEPMFRRALDVRERMLGKEHPATLDSLNALALLLFKNGDSPPAEEFFRQALEARERTLGREHRDTLASLSDLAVLLETGGDSAAAEPLCRRALEARERTLGKEHPDTLKSVNNLALLLRSKGDFVGAEQLYRQTLEALEHTLGKDHPDTLASMRNLSVLLANKGDFAGAESLYRRALEVSELTLGKDHPDTLIIVSQLAGVLRSKGDLAGAESLCRHAVETRRRTLGREHPYTLGSMNNLANLLLWKADYVGAEGLFRQTVKGRQDTLGRKHPDTLTSLSGLACVLDILGSELSRQPGKGEDAERVLREALASYRELGSAYDSQVAMILSKLASLGRSAGKLTEADTDALCREALTIAGTGSPQTLDSIAWGLATSGNPKLRDGRSAVLFATKAVERTGENNPVTLDTLAAAHAEVGRFANAAATQREAMALLQSDAQRQDYASRLRLYESGIPFHDPASLAQQVTVSLAEGKFAEAEPAARECLTLLETQIPDGWQTFAIRSLLGGSLLGQRKFAEAEPLLLAGVEGMQQREKSIPAEGRPNLKEALQRLVQLFEATGSKGEAARWSQRLTEFEQADAAVQAAAPLNSSKSRGDSGNRLVFRRARRSILDGFVRIPGGEFQMGDHTAPNYEGDADERPQHPVRLSAFHMAKYEVTKELWDVVADWASVNGYDIYPASASGKGANHPAYYVNWYECVKWCNARSQMEGLTPCYTVSGQTYTTGNSAPICNWAANGYRLPTAAEWQKAARGGVSGKRYPWGTDTISHAQANYMAESTDFGDQSGGAGYHPAYHNGTPPFTAPVGTFPPNGYGLYDMAGNVWEWCWDWYASSYDPGSFGTDPRGPASGKDRVGYGGSWNFTAQASRVTGHHNTEPSSGLNCGLRLVRSAVP